jgi:gliding motility-associated-like protein
LVQEFTEDQISTNVAPAPIVYEEKVVSLSAYAGQSVYIAFVDEYTQTGTTASGDTFLLDDILIVTECLAPTAPTATAPTLNSANLSWGNPSGSTSWEIEVMPDGPALPTGTGLVVNTNPYTVTALTSAPFTPLQPSTSYKYYVRAICTFSGSQWIGPITFSTVSLGQTCEAPITVTTLPYMTTDNTANYADNYDGTPGAAGCGTTSGYLDGNDVVYAYTPTANGVVDISMSPTATYSGIFVYNSCANIGVNCLAGVGNGGTGIRNIPNFAVTAGQTYYIVISTWAAPQTTAYTLTIQQVNCLPPAGLAGANVTQTSADISWTNPSGATSWEYVLQAPAAGIPTGAGTTIGTTSFNATGLSASTAYEFYVRADCGNGTFSQWSAPYLFNTSCGVFNVPFYEGFNSASSSEFCWTIVNSNGDTDTWDMNYTSNPFEGNQSAAINTDFNAGINNDWLISPAINLTGNQRLKFNYRVQSANEPNDFRVMISTTGTNPADFTQVLIPLASYGNISYEQMIQSLGALTGPVHIAFHVPNGGLDGWRLYIDNVIVENNPTCIEPNNLAIDNCHLSTSQDLSWSPGGSESNWEVVVQPSGSGMPTGSGVLVGTTNYTAGGLTAATDYEYYVRALCGGANGVSSWAGPFSFSTPTADVVSANAFCGDTGAIVFANAFDDPIDPSDDDDDLGQITCLGSTPNPVFYYFEVGAAGNLDFQITQNTSFNAAGNPTGTGLDVDFAVWGPFPNLAQACGNMDQGCPTPGDCPSNTTNAGFYPYGNIMDCSFSINPIENFSIANAQAGQVYAVLITNFDGDSGFIKLEQTNIGQGGAGSSDCGFLCEVDLGADQTICGGSSTILTASYVGTAVSISWFKDGVLIPAATAQTITVTQSGTYSVSVVKDAASNCSAPAVDSVVVTFTTPVVANDAAPYILCDDVTADGSTTFDLTTLNAQVLGALNPIDYTITYHTNVPQATSGASPIVAPNVYANAQNPQTIYIRVESVQFPDCFDMVTAQLVVNALPATSTASVTVQPTCTISTGTIEVTAPTGVNFEYSIDGTTYQAGTIFTGLAAGTNYNVLVRDVNTGCISLPTPMTVNAIPAAPAAPTASVTVQPTCVILTGTIDVTAPIGSNLEYSIDGTTYQAGTNFSGLVAGINYNVTVRDINTSCVSVSTPINVLVPVVPNAATLVVSAQPTCPIPTGTIEVTAPIGSGFEYSIDGGVVYQVSATFAGLNQGSYSVLVQDVNTGCVSIISAIIVVDPVPTPIAISIEEGCEQGSYILTASPFDVNLNYEWFNELNVSVGNTAALVVSTPGVYNVVVTDSQGCISQSAVTVLSTLCVFPKGISPNNDGNNDDLDLSTLNVKKLNIFSRYGTEVYSHGEGYTKQWKGQSNKGDELPDGTYYYVVVRGDGVTKTGWIYINR